jgi:hypothetical protein
MSRSPWRTHPTPAGVSPLGCCCERARPRAVIPAVANPARPSLPQPQFRRAPRRRPAPRPGRGRNPAAHRGRRISRGDRVARPHPRRRCTNRSPSPMPPPRLCSGPRSPSADPAPPRRTESALPLPKGAEGRSLNRSTPVRASALEATEARPLEAPARPPGVTSAGVVYRRPLGDLVLRLCGEFGGQGRVVGF